MPRELRLELPRHIATRPRRRRSNRPIAPAAGVESPRLSHKDPSTNWGRRPVGGGGRSCPGRVVAAPIAHRSHRMWPAGRLSSHGRETGGTGRDKSSKIRGAAGDAVHLGTHVWCGEPGRPCPHPTNMLPSPRGSAVTGCTLLGSRRPSSGMSRSRRPSSRPVPIPAREQPGRARHRRAGGGAGRGQGGLAVRAPVQAALLSSATLVISSSVMRQRSIASSRPPPM